MSQENSGDTYFEVQVDRETVVLAAIGLVVLLVIAFYAGRYTAMPDDEPSETAAQAVFEAEEADVLEVLAPPEEALEEVDGEPLFGENSVSVAGAPALGAVPARITKEPAEDVAVERRPTTPTRDIESLAPPETASPAPRGVALPREGAESAGGWVVQVGALKTMNDAEALQRRLSAEYPVRILEGGGFYKVQVGPYATRQLAKEAERSLKRREKLSTWVTTS